MDEKEKDILFWMFQNERISLESFLEIADLSYSKELLNKIEKERKEQPAKDFFRKQREQPYWYLRDGDLLPASVNEFCGGIGMGFDTIQGLKKLDNLFGTREEAAQASQKVREFISSLRLEDAIAKKHRVVLYDKNDLSNMQAIDNTGSHKPTFKERLKAYKFYWESNQKGICGICRLLIKVFKNEIIFFFRSSQHASFKSCANTSLFEESENETWLQPPQ